ncbi:BrnA antitoxin family protein [Xanthobacter dioxanivorans]|uniref:BrnA antitoxin family protein n=2 Tax=Xanthobacter dioxanivorans TaxID=2528964 RepID=A0A974PMI5_9HYPH|nr:BrnA antitoxin family protein [Xanthobacter dioxanivorans]QRG06327.1 BrnA antitoxin family protein [Xanthobacter dioxanivorans]
MQKPPFRRTGGSARDTAEAAFKSVTAKPVEAPPPAPVIPNAREMVSLRIDRDVLEHFQAGGPGWQERINAALRKIIETKP